MPKIFISHSSKDKEFVRRLAGDLQRMGVEPWLDEWEIKIGDCIVTKVEQGIEDSDFVAIVLTPHSVNSGWVEREWKAKYWDEIDRGETLVLPILAERCDIPSLLKTKKYANFAENYAVALVELMAGVGPVVKRTSEVPHVFVPDYSVDLTTLLGNVQNRSTHLSQCMAEALEIAQRARSAGLERFCRCELAGWRMDQAAEMAHRIIDVYTSFDELNLQYIGWRGNPQTILSYLRANPQQYPPSRMALPQPIAEIESRQNAPPKAMATSVVPVSVVLPNCDPRYADILMYVYTSPDCHSRILDATRAELTKRLLDLLPSIEQANA